MNFTDRIRRLPLKLLLHRFFSALLCLLLLGAMSIAVDRGVRLSHMIPIVLLISCSLLIRPYSKVRPGMTARP